MAGKENEKAPDAEAGEKTAKKPNKMIFIAVGAVLVLLAGAVVAKQLMGHPSKKAPAAEVGAHMRLDEFLVNLSDNGNDHYLKTNISLGLKKDVTEEELKEKIAPIRDSVLMVLTSKSLADVRTNDGKLKLKDELLAAINKKLGKDDVLEIDFETFATQ